MMRYKLFIFSFLIHVFCSAQNELKIDSLIQVLETDISDRYRVDTYLGIAKNYRGVDFEKVNMYSNKALSLAERSNYTEGIIDALFNIGVVALNQGKNIEAELVFIKMLDLAERNNYHTARVKAYRGLGKANRAMDKMDLALEYFFESLAISQKWNVNNEEAFNYNAIGLIYNQQRNYAKALEYFQVSLNLFEQLDNKKGISIIYINLGILYKEKGNFEKAIDFFNRSIEIEKVLNRNIKVSSGYFNLGQIYYQIKDYVKALEYYFESLKIHPTKIGKDHIIAETYSNIAKVYVELKDYDKALIYNLKSLKIYQDSSLDIKKPHVFYDIGQIYNIQNQTELARKYINLGLVSAQQQGHLKDIRDGAQQLALIEKKVGNYKRVYEANVLFMQMIDSLHNNEITSRIASLEGQYEFKKEKDSLYALRQQEITLNEVRTKQQKSHALMVYLFVGLILMIAIICFIVYNKSLQRKKIRRLRNRISRDLHDEIGSTLSSISLYGTVASASVVEDPKRTSELLTLINTYSSNTIESMNDIVWAIDSDNDTIGHMINRMRNFASEIEDTNEWKISIDYESKKIDKNLNMIQRRNMYLIFKESINNAIKYSNGKKISVTIDIEKSSIKLDVIDDGIGFDPDQITNKDTPFGGNGLKNMKKRARDLGGKLSIYSIINEGTQVSLEFNLETTPFDDTIL